MRLDTNPRLQAESVSASNRDRVQFSRRTRKSPIWGSLRGIHIWRDSTCHTIFKRRHRVPPQPRSQLIHSASGEPAPNVPLPTSEARRAASQPQQGVRYEQSGFWQSPF